MKTQKSPFLEWVLKPPGLHLVQPAPARVCSEPTFKHSTVHHTAFFPFSHLVSSPTLFLRLFLTISSCPCKYGPYIWVTTHTWPDRCWKLPTARKKGVYQSESVDSQQQSIQETTVLNFPLIFPPLSPILLFFLSLFISQPPLFPIFLLCLSSSSSSHSPPSPILFRFPSFSPFYHPVFPSSSLSYLSPLPIFFISHPLVSIIFVSPSSSHLHLCLIISHLPPSSIYHLPTYSFSHPLPSLNLFHLPYFSFFLSSSVIDFLVYIIGFLYLPPFQPLFPP